MRPAFFEQAAGMYQCLFRPVRPQCQWLMWYKPLLSLCIKTSGKSHLEFTLSPFSILTNNTLVITVNTGWVLFMKVHWEDAFWICCGSFSLSLKSNLLSFLKIFRVTYKAASDSCRSINCPVWRSHHVPISLNLSALERLFFVSYEFHVWFSLPATSTVKYSKSLDSCSLHNTPI